MGFGDFILFCCAFLDAHYSTFQFRKLYRIVRTIQSISGWVWDDETGASITPHTASSWDDYVKSHPEAKPFRNKGWRHFSKVSLLMPTTAVGAHVFHPTASQDEDPAGSPAPSEPNSAPQVDDPSETQDLGESDGDEVCTAHSSYFSSSPLTYS